MQIEQFMIDVFSIVALLMTVMYYLPGIYNHKITVPAHSKHGCPIFDIVKLYPLPGIIGANTKQIN